MKTIPVTIKGVVTEIAPVSLYDYELEDLATRIVEAASHGYTIPLFSFVEEEDGDIRILLMGRQDFGSLSHDEKRSLAKEYLRYQPQFPY